MASSVIKTGGVIACLVFGANLGTAVAQPAAPPAGAPPAATSAPGPGGGFPEIKPTPFYRVVPTGEMRTLAFVTALYPDCSPKGPVVMRLTKAPEHGKVTFEEGNSFPRFGPNTPLSSCDSKRVPGMRLNFEAAEGYEGLDSYRVLVIYPDGTASELDGRVSVR